MSVIYPQATSSTFPDKIDSLPQAMDVLSTDIDLINDYYRALANKGDIATALANIPNGSQKIDNAERYNKLRDCILAIENYVSEGGGFQRAINLEKNVWNNEIAQFGYMGVHKLYRTYLKNNIVSTQESGDVLLYIALKFNSGIPVTDTNYWRLFTISASGKYSTYRNNWVDTTVYAVNNCVTYKSQLYLCIDDNIAHEPDKFPLEWILLIGRGNSKQYPFQPTAPTNPTNGQIWFDTSV